jgi:hypothetical protein
MYWDIQKYSYKEARKGRKWKGIGKWMIRFLIAGQKLHSFYSQLFDTVLKKTSMCTTLRKLHTTKLFPSLQPIKSPWYIYVCFSIKHPHSAHPLYTCFVWLWEETALFTQQLLPLFCSENKTCFLWSTLTLSKLILTSCISLFHVAISHSVTERQISVRTEH